MAQVQQQGVNLVDELFVLLLESEWLLLLWLDTGLAVFDSALEPRDLLFHANLIIRLHLHLFLQAFEVASDLVLQVGAVLYLSLKLLMFDDVFGLLLMKLLSGLVQANLQWLARSVQFTFLARELQFCHGSNLRLKWLES